MSYNIDFVPIKGSTWEDFCFWIKQVSPRHMTFMNSTMGTLKHLCHGRLPRATLDDKTIILSWERGDKIFVLKTRISFAHPEKSDLSWSISGHDEEVFSSGEIQNVAWWPEKFITDFQHHWNMSCLSSKDILQLGLASIIVLTVFAGVILI